MAPASLERVDHLVQLLGVMIGHLPLPLGTAALAGVLENLERVVRLDGAPLEVGTLDLPGAPASLERVVRLDGAAVLAGVSHPAGVTLASLARVANGAASHPNLNAPSHLGGAAVLAGVQESLERVEDLTRDGAAVLAGVPASLERVVRLDGAPLEVGTLDLPGAPASLERADHLVQVLGVMIGHPRRHGAPLEVLGVLANLARVVLVLYKIGVMIGHRLGVALESLERVARLEAGVLLVLGATVLAGVLESLERVVRLDGAPLEVGTLDLPGALESLERVVRLDGAAVLAGVQESLVRVEDTLDGAPHGTAERVAKERLAKPRDRREAGLLDLLHGGVLPQESLARADQAEDGTVMAGRQVDRGGQVASLARADHGIKLASWFHSLNW